MLLLKLQQTGLGHGYSFSWCNIPHPIQQDSLIWVHTKWWAVHHKWAEDRTPVGLWFQKLLKKHFLIILSNSEPNSEQVVTKEPYLSMAMVNSLTRLLVFVWFYHVSSPKVKSFIHCVYDTPFASVFNNRSGITFKYKNEHFHWVIFLFCTFIGCIIYGGQVMKLFSEYLLASVSQSKTHNHLIHFLLAVQCHHS